MTPKKSIPENIMRILRSVVAKRARTVIGHIIEHGLITTEELKEKYGYNHPPRAARDVREQGIPLETFNVKDSTGRSIGAYRFAKWEDFRADKLKGRQAFSKQFKKDLVEKHGEQCRICSALFEERYLQIDHRVPYEIAGDDLLPNRNPDHYMLVCSSCNRAKSWSCEHCPNWIDKRDPTICQSCYWASPINYAHVAMRDIRRLEMVWQGNEAHQYDKVKRMADTAEEDMPTFVKKLLRRITGKRS
ncbi:MAG: HNH endonuclease [Nitrospinae bacterium]|nr:HNH endonuclease [Nitrospinota bacterium]